MLNCGVLSSLIGGEEEEMRAFRFVEFKSRCHFISLTGRLDHLMWTRKLMQIVKGLHDFLKCLPCFCVQASVITSPIVAGVNMSIERDILQLTDHIGVRTYETTAGQCVFLFFSSLYYPVFYLVC